MEKSKPESKLLADCDGDCLSQFRLFAGFKREELEALVVLCEEENHQAGDRIFEQGSTGLCMYVILKGSVRVVHDSDGQSVELAVLKEGDFFGELSLIDDEPRSASVIALEDCQLLVVTRMVVGVLAGIKPGAAIQLLAAIGRSLVKRLRTGNQRYLDLVHLGQDVAARQE